MYETGKHESGRVWLDHWVAESGRSASHRAHFSWHAALHDLALGDTEAVRQRYYSQLAPPTVTGVRALIDSASLLWRWRITTSDWPASARLRTSAPPPVECVLEAAGADLIDRPETPFVAMHSALALAAAGDLARLAQLRVLLRGLVGPDDVRHRGGPVLGPDLGRRGLVGRRPRRRCPTCSRRWSASAARPPSARSSRRRCSSRWSTPTSPPSHWVCSTAGSIAGPLRWMRDVVDRSSAYARSGVARLVLSGGRHTSID